MGIHHKNYYYGNIFVSWHAMSLKRATKLRDFFPRCCCCQLALMLFLLPLLLLLTNVCDLWLQESFELPFKWNVGTAMYYNDTYYWLPPFGRCMCYDYDCCEEDCCFFFILLSFRRNDESTVKYESLLVARQKKIT